MFANITKWRHYAFTWDGYTAEWYLDGKLEMKMIIDTPPLDFSANNEVFDCEMF